MSDDRNAIIEECAKVKVELRDIGSRSNDYLKGFEDACRAYIKAIRSLAAVNQDNGGGAR